MEIFGMTRLPTHHIPQQRSPQRDKIDRWAEGAIQNLPEKLSARCCGGKIHYQYEAHAHAAVQRVAENSKEQLASRCPLRGGWHIGRRLVGAA